MKLTEAFLQGTAGERNVPPQNYFISTANYNGEAAEDSIALTAKFEVHELGSFLFQDNSLPI